MPLNTGNSYFLDLAGRAASFRQKIEEPDRFIARPAEERLFAARLSAWKKSACSNDEEMFACRLLNDGITTEDLPLLLGYHRVKDEAHLPDWIHFFKESLAFLENQPGEAGEQFNGLSGSGPDWKIPFLPLILPLTEFSSRRVAASCGRDLRDLFDPEALSNLQLQLATGLSMYLSPVLFLEFSTFRSLRQSSLERILSAVTTGSEPATDLYEAFTKKIRNGWPELFLEYSVLARLVTTITGNWITNTSGFIRRLTTDYDLITNHFGGGIRPGRITGFHSGISDVHNHGQSVISLTFESGLRLVYKPKNLELEEAWSDLLKWYNQKGLSPGLKPIDVVNRGTYGWVGFIEAFPCRTKEEVRDYYRRVGSLVALIYILKGNDFHRENMIASGADPVLIDLESVMHHEGRPFLEGFTDTATHLAWKQFGRSVFRTGILPSWISMREGILFDISGIGSYEFSETPFFRNGWSAMNTDRMEMTREPYHQPEPLNIPVLEGRSQPPSEYTAEILGGFSALYTLTMMHRGEFPVDRFLRKELRFIFRATRIYGVIRNQILRPECLRDGTDRGIRFDMLSKAFLHSDEMNPFWKVFCSEARQMEEADFPIFWADSDKTDLKDNKGTIVANFMTEPVIDLVRQGLKDLDAGDLGKQSRFIRASLFYREFSHHSVGNRTSAGEPGLPSAPVPAVAELLKESLAIARTLGEQAIISEDGSCSWITISPVPGTERYRTQPMPMFLYDGISGVVLFLSALEAVSGDEGVARLTGRAMKTFQQGLDHMEKNRNLLKDYPVGITSGLPGIIYSLVKCAGFSGVAGYLDEALRVARFITPEGIGRDRKFDILAGSAGCILGLLALHRVTGEREVLEKARICGEHLVSHVVRDEPGCCGWKTMEGKIIAGFSHGTAGIAYALLRLCEAIGDPRYRELAGEAIRYENTLFSPVYGNWSDIRDLGREQDFTGPRFMTSWCHGAPGIGLARLAGSHILNNEEIEENLAAATETTLKAPASLLDHLCCGNFGRIGFLHHVALERKDPALAEVVLRKSGLVMREAGLSGHYRLNAGMEDDLLNPGLFQGLSGIGYALLRLAFPHKIPSVLIFD